MKIRLTDIPADGLDIQESIPPTELNERLSTGNNHGIQFIDPLNVTLTVYKSPNGAETKGTVTSRYRQPCARCIEGVERPLTIETNYYLQQRPDVLRGHETEEYEDDIGITFYDGEHIDLDDLIQESIILSLSIYWHPDEDSNGKCTLCKKDIHNLQPNAEKKSAKGVSLQDLLKKAGIE